MDGARDLSLCALLIEPDEEKHMGYDERIKDINALRSYLTDFFIRGFKCRDDFTQKSSRSYDNERRRIDSWLAKFYRISFDGHNRRVLLSVDSREIKHNPFYRIFKTKSFTRNDVMLHFLLMDILSDKKEHTIGEITHAIDTIYTPKMGQELYIEEGLVRLKLKEYCTIGILENKKRGKNLYYNLVDDGLKINPLRDMIHFFSEVGPLGVIGSYLLDIDDQNDSVFSFKRHYLIDAIDSDIVLCIVSCIKENKKVCISEKREKGFPISSILFPIKISISTLTGRQYLMAYDYEKQFFRSLRIDNIETAAEATLEANAQQLKDEYAEKERYLWGVSFGDGKQLDTVKVTLRIGEKERHTLLRLNREKRNGIVTRLEKDRVQFSTTVYDAKELLPWIRSYIGRIEHVESNNCAFREQLLESIQSLYIRYEGGSDAFSRNI